MDITIRIRKSFDVIVVDLEGYLIADTAEKATSILQGLIGERLQMVINLEKLVVVTSDGLRVVLKMSKSLKDNNGQLKICCPSFDLRRSLKLSYFSNLLDVYETREEALESFYTRKPHSRRIHPKSKSLSA